MIYVVLPVALVLGAGALWACVASIRTGQFDDLETPAVRILVDDTPRSGAARDDAPASPSSPPPPAL